MFSQRFLGAPRGKYCNSPERNVRRKVVSKSKKKNDYEDYRFFSAVLSELGWLMLIQGKRKFVLITMKYEVKSTD